MIPIHSSVPSHLMTEYTLLKSLWKNARDQHRSQPFIRRMEQVIRLTGRVYQVLAVSPESTNKLKALVQSVRISPQAHMVDKY